MPLWTRSVLVSRSGLASIVTVLALAMSAACASPSSVASLAADPPKGCMTLDNLREQVMGGTQRELTGTFPSLGDSGSYLDYIYDSSGQKVGTVFGLLNVPNIPAKPGHVVMWAHETIEFGGGTIEVQGIYDITDSEDGIWQYGPAIGISGGFREKVGKRWFKAAQTKGTEAAWLDVKIELCPPVSPR